LIWSGGVWRSGGPGSQLGVHRITVNGEAPRIGKYEEKVIPVSNAIEGVLTRQGIPRKVLDKMSEKPVTDVFILTNKWLLDEDLAMRFDLRPTYLDVAEKKCGQSPSTKIAKALAKANDEQSQSLPLDEDSVRWEACEMEFRLASQRAEDVRSWIHGQAIRLDYRDENPTAPDLRSNTLPRY
jgi:hypothetical protein